MNIRVFSEGIREPIEAIRKLAAFINAIRNAEIKVSRVQSERHRIRTYFKDGMPCAETECQLVIHYQIEGEHEDPWLG